MGVITGYPSKKKEDRTEVEPVTVEPVDPFRYGHDSISHSFSRLVASDEVEASSTTSVLIASSHLALAGDTIRFTSGTLSGYEVVVLSTTTNEITLAQVLPSAPSAADTFNILRHTKPMVNASGILQVSIMGGGGGGGVAGTQTIGMSNLGNTSGTTGVVTGTDWAMYFAGGNNVTLSQSINGSSGTITISAANQTGSQYSAGLSNLGNTSGDTGLASQRLVLAGGNNITLSGSTNGGSMTVTISAGAGGAGNTGSISAGTTRGTLGEVVFSNSNGISFGIDGQTLTAQHNALTSQSNQALSGSNGSFTFQTATFGNANGLSFFTSNGSMVGSYTVPTQSVQPGIQSASAGTTRITTGEVVFSNANGISFGANGQTITASHNGLTSQSNQNVTAANGGFAFQTLSFSNLNGISFGTSAGSAITASHNALTSQSNQAISAANGSFTFQTATFADSNGVSFSTGTQGIFATVKTDYLTSQSNQALSGSNGSFAFQTATFGNANGLSFLTSNGSMVGSYTVPTVHTFSGGMSDAGNTSGDTGFATNRLALVGGNNITLSGSTNGGSMTITISGAVGGGAGYTAGLSNIGNTAGDTGAVTGRLILAGDNNITLSGSTNGGSMTVSISGGNTFSQAISMGVSNAGNTAGETGMIRGTNVRMVFVGSNNITLSQATSDSFTTSRGTITILGPDLMSAGLSNIGNTSGDTGLASRRLVLAGGNNITLSGSTNGGSMTITISAPSGGAGGVVAGISTGGNTAGSSGTVSNQIVFAGTNGATLSQSTGGASSATLSIDIGRPELSYWNNIGPMGSNNPLTTLQFTASHRSLFVFPIGTAGDLRWPSDITANTFQMMMSISGSTATMSAVFTSHIYFGLYTRNGQSLSLLNSFSTSWGTGAVATANTASVHGPRYLTAHSSQWSATPVFKRGSEYFGAWFWSSAGSLGQTGAMFHVAHQISSQQSGTVGVSSATNTSRGWHPWPYGIYSATTAALPASIHQSQLNHVVNGAGFQPALFIDNISSVH